MPRAGRHAEGARTRQRILAAATELIGAQGYAATSIHQIGRAAGARPASIYWAFESKEGLLAAVMEGAADRFFDALPDGGFANDPWTALEALSAYFEGGPDFLRLMLVLSLERREGDPAVLEAARRVRTTAADGLARGYRVAFAAFAAEASGREVEIAAELARFTLMLFDGAFIASQIEPDTTNLKRTFELIATSVRATGERLLADARTT